MHIHSYVLAFVIACMMVTYFILLQHKKIFEFPAEQFYKPMELFFNQATAKEMENKAKNLKMFWPDCDPTMPFVFCDVIGTEKVTDTEFIDRTRVGQESKYNSQEADKIVRTVITYLYVSVFSCLL